LFLIYGVEKSYFACTAICLFSLVPGGFMKLNVPSFPVTYEGGKAVSVNAYERLKRTVLACMLFEDNFYEDGIKAVDRIIELCDQVSALQICALALDAAVKHHLRHVPLQMIVEALKKKEKHTWMADTIVSIITRPDMITDLLALYWKNGKKPIPHQLKRGLARAFTKFDEYQLSKYNRDNPIKLRDILFLCHAKPKDKEQEALWKRLINKELKTADTWETRLSAGENKNESFTELLQSHHMGKLAILRNLRNMHDSGVDKNLVASELIHNPKEMFPFQYIAAAREVPQWEDIIDPAMVKACSLKPKLKGTTIVLVDVSSSMESTVSGKSKMSRMDAACGLAILLREVCEEFSIITFSNGVSQIPPRQGIALRDAIVSSQPHQGTMLGAAIHYIHHNSPFKGNERWIVITDEQTADTIPLMKSKNNYILNIAGYQNGIGSKNQWTTITGFSEASIDFIRELENNE
jgi:60 kDa SS-A/Ro ribonucleoprotein